MIKKSLWFYFIAVFGVLVLLGVMRLMLLIFNLDLAQQIPVPVLLKSFLVGARFDLMVTAYACLPLILLPIFGTRPGYRKFCLYWMTGFASIYCFLAIIELYFYAEFQQRLNSLVFVYLREDPRTVLSMLWYGFPVVTLISVWAVISLIMQLVFKTIERATRTLHRDASPGFILALVAVAGLLLLEVAFARGTLRHGPPLRWGDAYHSDNLFANQLALNGSFTLAKSWTRFASGDKKNYWHKSSDHTKSIALVRDLVITDRDSLVDPDKAVIRRVHTPQMLKTEIRNIVIIIMESFSGQYVGALGNTQRITPEFDKLARQGLLFERFFSNGTHTHQGMFATLACFPNVPGYEYLMQQAEGRNRFSGISRLLDKKLYQNLYVYNGDFSWDNQEGFFRNQGMDTFIGRDDIESPKFIDPTWGVSDEDMFNQALVSLVELSAKQPFFAILQSLSNHTPYALPDPLPFEPVRDAQGRVSERLTPMKYSDWALGQFFKRARQSRYFEHTLFVILGDHGFVVDTQISDVNLLRFHVPLLLLGPGIVENYGHSSNRVATQVDVVPTVLGLLGKPFQHQCWGRNLLALPDDDQGIGVIKPSGGENTVAIVAGDVILTDDPEKGSHLSRYWLYPEAGSESITDTGLHSSLKQKMHAYVDTAIQTLKDNTGGDR